MRDNRLLLMALFFSVLMSSTQAFASSSNDASVPVPINTDPDNPGTGHRTPIMIPIQCYYSDGELTFTFSATLGTVECEVVRVSDDEVFDGTLYAISGGTDSLYVSTDADEYEITLTLSNGTVYYGEYTIE